MKVRPGEHRLTATHDAGRIAGRTDALSHRVEPEKVFAGIPWSSTSVLQATRERLGDIGARLTLLPTLYDVDRPEDIGRLVRDLAGRNPLDEDFPRATARALLRLKVEAPS